jgi:hypothetical protein
VPVSFQVQTLGASTSFDVESFEFGAPDPSVFAPPSSCPTQPVAIDSQVAGGTAVRALFSWVASR